MPKIIFWNTQRAKGKFATKATENLTEALEGLAAEHKPDAIVLCEMLAASPPDSTKGSLEPTGYRFHQVISGDYPKETSLCYWLLIRDNEQTTCKNASLAEPNPIFPPFPRPALFVTLEVNEETFTFAALHAQSSTKIGNQVAQLKSIIKKKPAIIIGDMNIDAHNKKQLSALKIEFLLEGYTIVAPDDATHRSKDQYKSCLDWALAHKKHTFDAKIVALKNPPSQDKKYSDGNDDEYTPKFSPDIKSDHLPIVIDFIVQKKKPMIEMNFIIPKAKPVIEMNFTTPKKKPVIKIDSKVQKKSP